MDMSVTRLSPAKHDGLEIKWAAPWVRHGHVHYPLDLVTLGLVTVRPQHLHDHVQGSGPG